MTADYFANWTDGEVRNRLEYNRRGEGQMTTYAMCCLGCPRGARGGGPCVECLDAELRRRQRHNPEQEHPHA